MSKDGKAFVSRHGRRTALNDEDLAGMLDEPVVKVNRQSHRSFFTKRRIVAAVIIIILLILVPVVIGEMLTAGYDSSSRAAKNDMKTLITQTVLPAQKRATITADSIASIATHSEAIRDRTCPGGVLDNMAALYPRAKEAYDDCIMERGKVAQVANSVRDLEKEARYFESVSPLLAPLMQNGSNDFAIIDSQLSNWKDFQSRVAALNPPANFVAADDAFQAAITQVVDGWSALNTASNAEDSSGFVAAEAQLAKGYQAVRDSVAGFDTALAKTQLEINQDTAGL